MIQPQTFICCANSLEGEIKSLEGEIKDRVNDI